ncbi:MAG: zinc-ribbon domain-containing protein [Candidatus Micrarchaeota archaeon]|nr:zinc-ribbon domain-containing protein [Candidatus Micrarchaeota archaeon]
MQKQQVDNLIICPKCGTPHLANAKYCTKCGYIFVSPHKKIKKETTAAKSQAIEKKSASINQTSAAAIENITKSIDKKIVCPRCTSSFSSQLKRCPKCGFKIK